MPSETSSFSLVARPLWDQLDARLDDAAARDPQNRALVESIRSPVTTLQLLAREAPAALLGDALAIERLRVLLQAASGAAALVSVATSTLRQYKDPNLPSEPGLLQLRTLSVLEAAALRTADDLAGMRYAIMVVTGLALSCGPAELLARLEPYGAADDTYDNLLQLVVPPIVATGVASRVTLRGHARDPLERARWRCLLEVAARIAGALTADPGAVSAPSATAPRFGAASIAELSSVTRITDGEHAGALLLQGAFPWAASSWPADAWTVVGSAANASGAPAMIAEVVEAHADRLIAKLPPSVAWVGLVERARLVQVDRARAALREALAGITKLPCAQREPAQDLTALLPPIGAAWPFADPPPRGVRNQLAGAVAAPPPSQPVPGEPPANEEPSTLTVVVVRVMAADTEDRVAEGVVKEALAALSRRLSLSIVSLELPWVEDDLAVVSTTPGDEDDPRVSRMIEALARTAARTPDREQALFLAIVPGASLLAATATADAALGLGVATLSGLARALAVLLESNAAAPSAAAPTRAGRLTVLSRTGSLAAELPRARATGERLRLVGVLEGTELTLLEPPRYEHRGAGRGAPVDTGAVAVCLGADERELGRFRLRGHRDAGPIALAALVPVTPEVAAVEVRREPRLIARLERSVVAPRSAALELDHRDGIVTARWSSPRANGPVAITVEVSDQKVGTWVPIGKVAACSAAETMPLWRLGSALRLRLVACDGWHAVGSKEVDVPQGTLFGPVAIRRIDDRTLWAELPANAVPQWRTALGHLEKGRVLSVDSGAGTVELSVVHGAAALTDAIELEQRRALRRR